jgi:hypothetical protein
MARFWAHFDSKFAKSGTVTYAIFSSSINLGGNKKEIDADFNTVEKLLKISNENRGKKLTII